MSSVLDVEHVFHYPTVIPNLYAIPGHIDSYYEGTWLPKQLHHGYAFIWSLFRQKSCLRNLLELSQCGSFEKIPIWSTPQILFWTLDSKTHFPMYTHEPILRVSSYVITSNVQQSETHYWLNKKINLQRIIQSWRKLAGHKMSSCHKSHFVIDASFIKKHKIYFNSFTPIMLENIYQYRRKMLTFRVYFYSYQLHRHNIFFDNENIM